jgi:prepilin-type N-terminal cleavage/methylation domain-containing protein
MKMKGYTLVEMMVVVALLSVVGVAVVAMFLTTSRGGGKAGAMALVKQEGDYAITTMERYIHFAKSAECPAGNDVNIVWNDDVVVRFEEDLTNRILRTVGPDTSYITSDQVAITNLAFVCSVSNGVQTVDIDFTINPTNGDVVTENFHSKVVLRNKAN